MLCIGRNFRSPVDDRLRHARQQQGACHRVRQIVMASWSVIDKSRPPRAVRRSSRKAGCQVSSDPTARTCRCSASAIRRDTVTLHLFRRLVDDAILAEAFARPFACVSISHHLRDTVALSNAQKSLTTPCGENGGLTSRTQSSTVTPNFRSWWLSPSSWHRWNHPTDLQTLSSACLAPAAIQSGPE